MTAGEWDKPVERKRLRCRRRTRRPVCFGSGGEDEGNISECMVRSAREILRQGKDAELDDTGQF